MIKRGTSFLILGLFSIIILGSCDTTENSGNTSHPTLEWSVDTITYPGSYQTLMRIIWGNSNNDLWVAGHNELGRGKMFHFDGIKWIDVVPMYYDSYIPEYNSVFTINDITYLAGSAVFWSDTSIPHFIDSTLILRQNGKSWIVSQIGIGSSIFSINGNQQKNKYLAGGSKLTLFEYINSIWIKKDISYLLPQDYETENINDIVIDENNDAHVVIFCYNQDPYYSYNYYIKEVNGEFSKIDSFHTDLDIPQWGLKLWKSNTGIIYSFNPGVYKLAAGKWTSLFENNDLITAMKGTTDNNIFAAGYNLWHYNGSDWKKINNFSNYGLARDMLIMGNQIFILFSDGRQSYIIKCNLNNN